MRDEQITFRHESLLEAAAVQDLLKAVGKAVAKGKLSFSDDDGEVVLEPPPLLDVKVTASSDSARHRVTLRLSWRVEERSNKVRGDLRVG